MQEIPADLAFANPELLVTTEWLAAHRQDENLTLVDVRSATDFRTGHIPGSRNVSTKDTFKKEGPDWMLGTPEQVASLFGEQGISAETRIILIDEGRSTQAARVFWSLEVFGHQNLSVLDGGLAKWKAEERELTREEVQPTPVAFEIERKEAPLSTKEILLEDLDRSDVVFLDARSNRENKSGRIPGSVHIEWTRNYTDDEAPVFKTPAQLAQLYADQGVTRDKKVHAY